MLIVFYVFVALFAAIGSMRGWAKELLVIFSIILALAFISVVENLIPVLGPFIKSNPMLQFYFRIVVVIVLTFFGYQSPRIARLAKASERRDRIQDILLGMIIGAVSGYMVAGTIWSYWHSSGYPVFTEYVIAPSAQQVGGAAALRIIEILPPEWLGKAPNIYIAVVLAFIFVIAVFV
jgi:hypothetical protein